MLRDFAGPKLKELRKRSLLTQMQVVDLTGVSEATLCYLERGDRRPQSKTLEKLLTLYTQRIKYLDGLENVLKGESNERSINHQTPVRPGSTGFRPR